MNKRTIESRVASTILETPKSVRIGWLRIMAKAPSIGTLILVSEAVSKLPAVKMNGEYLVAEILANAKDCRGVADIMAILLLGSKRIKRYGWMGIQRIVANAILNNSSPKELQIILSHQLQHQQIGDFFTLTTSLIEINLLSPTRKVVTIEATVSGQ